MNFFRTEDNWEENIKRLKQFRKKIQIVGLEGWYITKIKEPYYMALDDFKGTFFEKENPPINKRRWPHFMDFQIIGSFESKIRLDYGKREDLAKPLAESYNYGNGTPAPITRGQWDELIDRLNVIREKVA